MGKFLHWDDKNGFQNPRPLGEGKGEGALCDLDFPSARRSPERDGGVETASRQDPLSRVGERTELRDVQRQPIQRKDQINVEVIAFFHNVSNSSAVGV